MNTSSQESRIPNVCEPDNGGIEQTATAPSPHGKPAETARLSMHQVSQVVWRQKTSFSKLRKWCLSWSLGQSSNDWMILAAGTG